MSNGNLIKCYTSIQEMPGVKVGTQFFENADGDWQSSIGDVYTTKNIQRKKWFKPVYKDGTTLTIGETGERCKPVEISVWKNGTARFGAYGTYSIANVKEVRDALEEAEKNAQYAIGIIDLPNYWSRAIQPVTVHFGCSNGPTLSAKDLTKLIDRYNLISK